MNIKEELNKIINNLEENSNWDDIMYQIYVLQSVEEGLKQVKNNELISFEKVKNLL